MLTEQAIRETTKRQTRPIFYATAFGYLAMFLGLFVFDATVSFAVEQFGEAGRDYFMAVAALLLLAVVLATIIAIAQRGTRYKMICPLCGTDVSSRHEYLLATRRCPSCKDIIVEGGRVRSPAVYKRYVAIRMRSRIKVWLWAWPAVGMCAVAAWLVDRSILEGCPKNYVVAPILGTALSGWAWLRTFDRRYFPPLLASIGVLVAGGAIFWETLLRPALGW